MPHTTLKDSLLDDVDLSFNWLLLNTVADPPSCRL